VPKKAGLDLAGSEGLSGLIPGTVAARFVVPVFLLDLWTKVPSDGTLFCSGFGDVFYAIYFGAG
jgi:hypothetical protein